MKVMPSAAAAALVVAATLAYAQVDVIKARQSLMQANQDALDRIFAMADGRIPFDAAAAQAALTKYNADYATLPSLFPDGSNTADSKALPAVWSNKAAFAAEATKLSNDAKAAAAAATSLAALSSSGLLDVVGRDCTGCHTQFRAIVGPPGGGFFPGGPPPGGFPGGPRPGGPGGPPRP